MRIQEMRPGISHLRKKTGDEGRDNIIGTQDPETWPALPSDESELDEPRWSVISFEKTEAAGLYYKQAAELVATLDSRGVAGLCIVTDEAAARIR